MSAWIPLFGLPCYGRQGELDSLVLSPPDEEILSSFVNFHKWGVSWFCHSHRTSWHFQAFVLEIIFPIRHNRNLFLYQMNVWRFPSFLQLALEICWLIYSKIHKGREFYAGQPLASSSYLKISCKLCSSDAVFLLLPFSETSTGQILSIGSFPAFLRSFLIFLWEMWELGREKKTQIISKSFEGYTNFIMYTSLGLFISRLRQNSIFRSSAVKNICIEARRNTVCI